VKRRALQQATSPKSAEAKPGKIIEVETRTEPVAAKASPAKPASSTTPASKPTAGAASTQQKTQPKFASSTQPSTSPHGTRPATLYYSSGPAQDKETPSPMKSTPAATPASSTSASSTSAPRATTTAASTRPASVVDYRTNVDRQAREQKSVGGILSILVYTLIGLFVLGGLLAGYGIFVLSKQIDQQSVTVSDLDKRYSADNQALNAKLATTLDTLTTAQAQIGRQQELIVKQQDTINKLLAASEDNASAIRQEKAARAQETSNLRAKLRDLEYQGPSIKKY